MEAEPYMYKGQWEDVVRVAEEGLPHCWEIREWSPLFWVSAWAAIAYVRLGRRTRKQEGSWSAPCRNARPRERPRYG